jgi:hypothetical protein
LNNFNSAADLLFPSIGHQQRRRRPGCRNPSSNLVILRQTSRTTMETLPAEILVEILTFVCADIVNSLDDVNSQGEPLFATRLKAYPKLLLVSSKFHKLVGQVRINGQPIRKTLLFMQKLRFNCMVQAASTGRLSLSGPGYGYFKSLSFCKRWCGSVWKNPLLEEMMPLVMWSPCLYSRLRNRFIFTAVRGLKHLIESATPIEENGDFLPQQPMPVSGFSYTWENIIGVGDRQRGSRVRFVVGKYRFKRQYETQLTNSVPGPQTWVGCSVVSCTVTNIYRGFLHGVDVRSEVGEQDRYWLWLACGPRQGDFCGHKLFDYQEEKVYEKFGWEDIDYELKHFSHYKDDGKSFWRGPGTFPNTNIDQGHLL